VSPAKSGYGAADTAASTDLEARVLRAGDGAENNTPDACTPEKLRSASLQRKTQVSILLPNNHKYFSTTALF
jgi:hypothetical protein